MVATIVEPIALRIDPITFGVDPIALAVDPITLGVDPITLAVDPKTLGVVTCLAVHPVKGIRTRSLFVPVRDPIVDPIAVAVVANALILPNFGTLIRS